MGASLGMSSVFLIPILNCAPHPRSWDGALLSAEGRVVWLQRESRGRGLGSWVPALCLCLSVSTGVMPALCPSQRRLGEGPSTGAALTQSCTCDLVGEGLRTLELNLVSEWVVVTFICFFQSRLKPG